MAYLWPNIWMTNAYRCLSTITRSTFGGAQLPLDVDGLVDRGPNIYDAHIAAKVI